MLLKNFRRHFFLLTSEVPYLNIVDSNGVAPLFVELLCFHGPEI